VLRIKDGRKGGIRSPWLSVELHPLPPAHQRGLHPRLDHRDDHLQHVQLYRGGGGTGGGHPGEEVPLGRTVLVRYCCDDDSGQCPRLPGRRVQEEATEHVQLFPSLPRAQ